MSDTVAPPLPDLFAAELQAGDQTFRLRAEAGQELALGRHSEDRSYRPDVDLGDLPNGRTVSRRHARLFRQDDEWFLRVKGSPASWSDFTCSADRRPSAAFSSGVAATSTRR